jgi:hypothetical protein
VSVTWGEPIAYDGAIDRKDLARTLEAAIRGHTVAACAAAACGVQAIARCRFIWPQKGARQGCRRPVTRICEEWNRLGQSPLPSVGCKTAQALRQILRLPDERLRFPSYGGPAGARGLCRDRRPEDADLVILNTCHIREKAAEKVYSELGRVRVLKQSGGAGARVTVAVAGCVAQAEGEEIIRRAPVVDLVVGRRAITGCRAAGARGRGGRDRVSGRGQVRVPAAPSGRERARAA